MVTVSIIGGSGFVGGELLRILLGHPEVEIVQVTSERFSGSYLKTVHPHLRGRTQLKFESASHLKDVDAMFLALPHGYSSNRITEFDDHAEKIIDLSSDFRFASPETYSKWYGKDHPNSAFLEKFVYGLPELWRNEIRDADYVAVPGCNATISILSLFPLRDLIRNVTINATVGTSEGGRTHSEASHHPIRSGSMRTYRPVLHRHIGEIEEQIQASGIAFSATSVDIVRGAMVNIHVQTDRFLTEKDLWKIYRRQYGAEPFVRLINERRGIFRYPDPRLVAGTNFADIGFVIDPHTGGIVVIGAIDNLMKGAAGQSVQAFNLMNGFEETLGLDFHPIFPL
ncbi:MAG: N-acetyl-gamma-glutamyl-phosphate reductase [Methanobacteriota archaeon]|nr:MAG: N-acetyl-gamma-glutamyl-phosphate reductase [Euryarchaeota archaeon]